MDLCFEFATQVMNRLAGVVTVQDEVHGFRYFDERDLMGFVDGTESPGGRAGEEAALVGAADPAADPDFTGGSYVIVQKYLHDLVGWNALSTEEQEQAIGRHKLSDIEIPDDQKAPNSHVALNTIEDADGNQQQLLRANMPFGSVAMQEFGTYYIGYAASPSVTERMLENMFIGDPPGNTDRILDFSTAVTGTLFFAPSADFLDDLPDPPAPASSLASSLATGGDAAGRPSPPEPARPGTSPQPSGSLGIGSLKRSASS
jgi:putative iron-dependent peroxidase